ncbi:MAG: SEC-C metal-binding domain-containing protein [Kiritimatiellia bacterium]
MSTIGRNASCPCGSGKKYWKSCMGALRDPATAIPPPAGTGLKGVPSRWKLSGIQTGCCITLRAFNISSTSSREKCKT